MVKLVSEMPQHEAIMLESLLENMSSMVENHGRGWLQKSIRHGVALEFAVLAVFHSVNFFLQQNLLKKYIKNLE